MEPRFNRDFSGVRVHYDAGAAQSARRVGAQAYTVGRSIVFDHGYYAPDTSAGRKLIAHELTHVVQQGGSALPVPGSDLAIDPSPAAEKQAQEFADRVMSRSFLTGAPPSGSSGIQRLPLSLQRGGQDRCSGSGAACASDEACLTPDKGPGKDGGEGTAWTLTVNVDIERDSWESALRNQELGHTYVRFADNAGRQYTYGFYPAKELPNESRREVPGCVHHPDATHDSCIDDRVTYSLTKEQFETALALAQKLCKDRHVYGQTYTCTTYAADVARAGGQELPSSRSQKTTIFSQPIPEIDNPNTLHENVQAEFAKDPTKKGFWNTSVSPVLRLRPVGGISLSGDPKDPILQLEWLPVADASFRWRLLDGEQRHYLLRGGEAGEDVLDWLDFTSHSTALIGKKTRELLRARGATRGTVECTVRHPAWKDQVIRLAIALTP